MVHLYFDYFISEKWQMLEKIRSLLCKNDAIHYGQDDMCSMYGCTCMGIYIASFRSLSHALSKRSVQVLLRGSGSLF